MKKYFFVIIISIMLITLTYFIFTGCNSSNGNNSFNNDFALDDLDGNEISLSDFNGKIIVLNFWATWCPPCKEEIPDFVEIYNNMYEDVQFLGVSNEDIFTLKSFVRDYNISYPILIDNANVMEKWKIRAIPTTFIFDRNGEIIFKNVGMMTGEQLKNILEDAL